MLAIWGPDRVCVAFSATGQLTGFAHGVTLFVELEEPDGALALVLCPIRTSDNECSAPAIR
ncbi:MAG TPA: hypothetical protein DEV72_04750 [Ktedonobacter sp.]|nr:hypothetical protein [Ktedonobacter sp.]